MTAAATTGPNSDPRPTSSTPATYCAPESHARFSNLRVQRSFFNRRNLAAEAEILSRSEPFDGRAVGRASSGLDGAKPRPRTGKTGRRLLLFDFFQSGSFSLEPAQIIELG